MPTDCNEGFGSGPGRAFAGDLATGNSMSSTSWFLSNKEVLGGEARRVDPVDPEALRKQILDLLSQSPKSLAALVDAVAHGEQQVTEALAYLRNGKLVQERSGEGSNTVYELTDYARAVLSVFTVKR
jgi:hypothetical protein